MSQKFTVHKNESPFTGSLWWLPVLDVQNVLNRNLGRLTSGFMPPGFWDEEESIFESFRHNMDRLFRTTFNNRKMISPLRSDGFAEPNVDILENGKEFKVKADLPGLDAEDVDVSVTDDALVIQAQKEDEKTEKNGYYIRRECRRSFNRVITLPEDADLEHATAEFSKNVLTVAIPKKEIAMRPQKRRQIKVGKPDNRLMDKSRKKAA